MTPEVYAVEACAPGDLSETDLVTCFAIIRSGEAVNPATMRAVLPRALVLVLARKGGRIVAVGAIKPVRLLLRIEDCHAQWSPF
jgi:hypothetical protein